MIIAVDFDGVLCENRYPNIGGANKKLIKYLVSEQRSGNKLILWTCRRGEELEQAVDWCKKNGLQFDAVNENLDFIIESFGGNTRKVFANVYIDDRNADKRFCAKYNIPFSEPGVESVLPKRF